MYIIINENYANYSQNGDLCECGAQNICSDVSTPMTCLVVENIKGCYEVITYGFVKHRGYAVNDDAGIPVFFTSE